MLADALDATQSAAAQAAQEKVLGEIIQSYTSAAAQAAQEDSYFP